MHKKLALLVSTILVASSPAMAKQNTIQINEKGVQQLALTDDAKKAYDAKKNKMIEHKKARAEKHQEIKNVKQKYHEKMKEEKQAHKANMKEMRENMKNDIKAIKGQADSQAQ